MNRHARTASEAVTPTALWQGLDADAPLAERHLWLIGALDWVRGPGACEPAACRDRLHRLLDALEADPGRRVQWRRWWARFTDAVDPTLLLADYGFAPRTSFLSEFGHRLRHKLLPGTPETSDLGELFGLLFPHPNDADWLRALDTETLRRVRTVLFTPVPGEPSAAEDTPPSGWNDHVLDAVVLATGQVAATGFAAEIRVRMSPQALRGRPFHRLYERLHALREAVQRHGRRSPEVHTTAQALREQLDACRHAAYTVYAHLAEHGVSVGIVFRLKQLRERVLRIKQLLEALQSDHTERATAQLLAQLVQLRQEQRSLRALVASSAQLTAAKVAERSAESGEHYITRNAQEYRQMLGHAAGGGLVLGFTTWGKFALGGLGLSAFWGGLGAGLNYALSFVLVQWLHFTVATKQPAVTAPAMVAKLRHLRQPGAMRAFVDEVAHLLRSQIAAILGNLGLVVPTVALLSLGLLWARGRPMIDRATAEYVLHSHSLLGPTALFAAFTGVLLFASSIVAGWVENWCVLHRLDSALQYNPRITGWLGRARAARWAGGMRQHVSGFAANVSLGLMLGLIPAFAGFFGLGLEVRHVTLSAGQLTAAAMSLGLEVWHRPDFWLALGGVLVVGPLNLAVSFYLAFRLALKAQAISDVNRGRIRAALLSRWRQRPGSFFRPPTPAEANGG